MEKKTETSETLIYNPRPRNDFERRLFKSFEKMCAEELAQSKEPGQVAPNLRAADFGMWQEDY